MGRKSSTKKIIREILKEKEFKEREKGLFTKKKSKEELKEELKNKPKNKAKKTKPTKKGEYPEKAKSQKKEDLSKKQNPPKKAASKAKKSKKSGKLGVNKKTLFSGAFTVIMIVALIAVGYLLFQKAFRARPIAKLLPANSTVAVLDINTNFDHNQLNKAFKLLENYPEYSEQKMVEKIETKFSVNYENDIATWLGRQVGLAILNSEKEEGAVYKVYFAEFISKKNLEDFLNKHDASVNTYAEQNTYIIEGARFLTVIDNYVFLSSEEQAIYELIDAQKEDRLYSSSKYRKIDDNLPLNNTAFLYIDFDQITDGLFQRFQFLSEKGLSMENLGAVLKLFDAEGLSLIAMDNNFAVQSFLSLDSQLVEKINPISPQKKYTAELTDYVLPDVLAFVGSENLESQFERIIEVLAGGNQMTLTVFDSLLQSYTQKYFGMDVNFKQDILLLFKNEFAFVVEQVENENIYKVVFELEELQRNTAKLHEIAGSFASVGAIFEPKIVERILEDGTVGKEIIAVPEEITKSESKYKDTTIYGLSMGKKEWGIYYATMGNVAIIANNPTGVKNSIDVARGDRASLKSTETFAYNIAPVLKSSDEVSYFNFQGLLPILFEDESGPGFLKTIASISSGRNYFNDGVVTISYLRIN